MLIQHFVLRWTQKRRKTILTKDRITTRSDPAMWIQSYVKKGVIDLCTYCDSVEQINQHKTRLSGVNDVTHSVLVVKEKVNIEENRIAIDLYSKLLTDDFNQLPSEIYNQLIPRKHCTKIRLGGTMAQELSSAYSVKKLFDAGYLLEIQSARNQMAVPCLHQVKMGCERNRNATVDNVQSDLPVPGNHYRLSNICAEAGLNHKSRSHRIYKPNKGHQRVIVLSQSYKNDYDSIKKFLTRLDESARLKEPRSFLDGDFDGTIWIHGSGGSPSFPGDVPPNADVNSKADPMIVIPRSQELTNSLNVTLMEMVMGSEVVTIYVNESLFHGGTNRNDGNMDSNLNPYFHRYG